MECLLPIQRYTERTNRWVNTMYSLATINMDYSSFLMLLWSPSVRLFSSYLRNVVSWKNIPAEKKTRMHTVQNIK